MIDNLTLYKFFLQAAKSGSVTNAARELFVTQPAVSSGITQLENALGVKLFFRTSKGITLTPEGELLYEYVNSGLSLLETGEDKLRDLSGLNSGIMRIGASDMTLKFFLLDYIEKFNLEYPKIKLVISNNPTPKTLAALKQGQIDFCVISEPAGHDADIAFIPVRYIRDIAVCRNTAPYAGLLDKKISLNDLKGYTLIMLEKGTSTRTYWADHFKAHNAHGENALEPDIELAQSELIKDFAVKGLGVAFIVEDFVKDQLKSGILREIIFEEPIAERRFMLCYLNKIPLSASPRKFMEMLSAPPGNYSMGEPVFSD